MKRSLVFAFPFLAALTAAGPAAAAVRTEKIEYRQGETVLKGYLAFNDSATGKKPGVVVFPEWWGVNDYAKRRAEQLAKLGYVALAADLYGNGTVTTDPKQAAKLSGELRGGNRALLRERADAALRVLAADRRVDPERVAAIGYCFGGTAALELLRAGSPLRGVVSFHGGLATPLPAQPGPIRGKVLVLHGADDPMVPPAEVAGFEDEMRAAGADWQMNIYGGAVHAFTNPDAGKAGIKGVAYNEKADRRSWEAMRLFFGEIFGESAVSP